MYIHLFLAVTLGIFALTGSSSAQERTAGSALETQMNWTALATMAKAANDKAEAVDARVNQTIVCGKKGMVYAPGAAGTDGEGCLTPATASGVINQLTNLQNTNNGTMYCGGQGRTFNGSSCVTPFSNPVAVSCRLETTGALGGGNSGYNGCPGGYTVVRGYNTGSHTTSCLRVVCN